MPKDQKGSGTSKIPPTSEKQNQVRRDKKGKPHHGGRGVRQGSGVFLFDGIAQDRAAAREERWQKVIDRALERARPYLVRYGETIVHKDGTKRRRWSEDALAAAVTLLQLYFWAEGDGQAEIAMQEGQMGPRVVEEVRRRFATACLFDQNIRRTPGQNQPWFEGARKAAAEFHSNRRAAATAAREEASSDHHDGQATDKALVA